MNRPCWLTHLDLLHRQVDRLCSAEEHIHLPGGLHEINGQISRLLALGKAKLAAFEKELAARSELQQFIGDGAGLGDAAAAMLLKEQQQFYNQLLQEITLFFSGRIRDRCVRFALTVPELLFFIRLLLDEEVMHVQALKPIFMFLSAHAGTRSQDQLSYESLRKKYSMENPDARVSVRNLLLRLVKRIDQSNGGIAGKR